MCEIACTNACYLSLPGLLVVYKLQDNESFKKLNIIKW